MENKFNILFTSAGRRVSLIQGFRESLKGLKINGEIIAVDGKKNAPAFWVADKAELVPPVTDKNYIGALLELCKKHEVRLVIPLIDTELLILAEKRDFFEQHGIQVLISSPETVRIASNKLVTARFFQDLGIATPKIIDMKLDPISFPCLVKPADGSCSVGVTKIKSADELLFFSQYTQNAMVQEYICGEEYTLDILVDFEGKVCCVVPRLRLETRAGEVSKGMTVKNVRLIDAGKRLVESLPGAVGCITVQCFLTNSGEIVFIEINPRFGGGFPLSKKAGADFPRWIIEMVLKLKPTVQMNSWQDELVMLRYDDAIFLSKDQIS